MREGKGNEQQRAAQEAGVLTTHSDCSCLRCADCPLTARHDD